MKQLAAILASLMLVLVATTTLAAGGHQAVRGERLGIAKALGLSKDQTQAIGAVLKQYRADVAGVLKSGISKDEKKPKVQALRAKATADIGAVLTPAQLQAANDRKLIERLLRSTTWRTARFHWVLKQLNLDQNQKDQVRKIIEDKKAQAQAIKADTSLTPEARLAKLADLRKDTIEKIKAILTPEQQQKLQDLMRNRPRGKTLRAQRGAAVR